MDLVNTVDFEKNTLPVLEEYFDTYIKALKATRDRIELKNCIAFEFKTLVKSFIEIGNKISNSSVILEDKHLINYILSEDFKIIMILHRNVFLELCKVAICKQENQLSDNQIINHYQSSKEILENKLLDFIDLIRLEKNKTTKNCLA